LLVLWLLSLAASLAVSAILLQLYQEGTAAQAGRAEAVVARACDLIRNRYGFYTAGWNGSGGEDAGFRKGLGAVVAIALAHEPGVGGGIWQAGTGSLAYAFPTYEGRGPAPGMPAGERARIAAVNEAAAQAEQTVLERAVVGGRTLLLFACPLGGPVADVTGWTMIRLDAAGGSARLGRGLGVLLLMMVGLTAWIAVVARGWSLRVRAIERALAGGAGERLPRLAPTGDPDLDRIVAGLNEAGERLEEAKRRSAELAERLAKSERLAALGRMAAELAHEVRNPLAAMRLKAENALAAGGSGWRETLYSVLGQIARLDRLVGDLLAMTHRRVAEAEEVGLEAFLARSAEDHREIAAARGVRVRTSARAARGHFDAEPVRQAIGNLLLNAIEHTPAGGEVRLEAEEAGMGLRFLVANGGAGVAAELRETLFEPFVTGRAEGTGLGLAIARELVEASGGTVSLLSAGGPEEETVFAVELPCRES
jgi:signal transduction histidine kinase